MSCLGYSSTKRTKSTTPRVNLGANPDGVGTNTIVAIVEGRGQARGEVGMAFMDLCTPHIILSQFTDTQSYIKVMGKMIIFQPVEILMPATCCELLGQPSRLYIQLQKEFPEVPIVPLQRRVFNEAHGLDRIKQLVAEQFFSVVHLVTTKYYSLAAAAALIKYLELVQSIIFTPRTVKIEFQVSENSVMIDSATVRHLELLQNNHFPNSSHSLYGIVNACRTPGGARMLRMNILQPPCDVEVINIRLKCVEELMTNSEILFGLMNVLGQLPVDMESVIATLIQAPRSDNERVLEQRINYVIFLKQILSLLPIFVQVLESAQSDYFQAVRESFCSTVYGQLLEKIGNIINDEARITKGTTSMRMQRSFAVRPQINPILDIARKAYCEIQEDINDYVIGLSKDLNMNFRLMESSTKGFYLQFILPGRVWELPDLPQYFLNVHKQRNIVTFSTETLLHCEKRLNEILLEIQSISSMVISELVGQIRDEIGSLYIVSEAVSTMDLLYSLANYSLTTHSVRPEFSKYFTAITKSRHPILDSISSDPTIPNNMYMSVDSNISVITGPNMSGKTTFLKQIATLQILAQIGCYVPAEAATFRPVNGIFSRIGNGDNLEGSASTFALEMTEMHYILENANNKSLIIIDELGRSTSIEEGTAMTWALIEDLMKRDAFVLIATHFLFLTKMEAIYNNVLNYKLETTECIGDDTMDGTEDENIRNPEFAMKLNYTHEFKRGVTNVEYYGLKLTKNSSYPPDVVENAMVLAKQIISSGQNDSGYENENEKGLTHKSLHLLGSHVRFLAKSVAAAIRKSEPVNSVVFGDYLKNLQREFKECNAI